MITLNSLITSYKCVCSSKMPWTPQQKAFCATCESSCQIYPKNDPSTKTVIKTVKIKIFRWNYIHINLTLSGYTVLNFHVSILLIGRLRACSLGNVFFFFAHLVLTYVIDIDEMLKLTQGQGHKVKGQGIISVYVKKQFGL